MNVMTMNCGQMRVIENKQANRYHTLRIPASMNLSNVYGFQVIISFYKVPLNMFYMYGNGMQSGSTMASFQYKDSLFMYRDSFS